MNENKGTYVFDHKLLDKRIKDLRETEPTAKDFLVQMIELTDEMAALAGAAILSAPLKVAYTDEEVRELARYLNAIIKAYDVDCFPHNGNRNVIEDARGFLHSKKYFNLNQSDLIV